MQKFLKLFTDHPHSIGESYFGHLFFAIRIGSKLFVSGILCLIHGLFPFVFKCSVSNSIIDINKEIEERTNKN